MAAAKKPKAVRGPQYTSICEAKGVTFCSDIIYGFRFENKSKSDVFHYRLMESGAKYLIYDGVSEKVRIITTEDIETIRAIAEKCGGVEYKPNIINDYE